MENNAKYRLVQRGDGSYFVQILEEANVFHSSEWIFFEDLVVLRPFDVESAELHLRKIILREENTVIAVYDASGNRVE
jgi:hypothetical protein